MKVIRIGDFITEISDKTTTNNQYMVLTSSQEGIVSQDEYFNKQVASKDTTGYKIVKRGQFTYRAMSDTGRFYINQLTQYEVGIVSPAYPVFEVIENDTLHPSFLHMFFRSEYFQALIANQSSGSTRVSLRMDKIKKIELAVPEYEDQIHIVEKIAKMETIIADRKQQLALLDELVKSRFIELFGDGHDGKTQLKMLGSICKFQQGTQIPVEEQFEEQISGYKRFLRIIDYTQAPQPPRYVNVNGKEVDEKSVVIVRYGATAGFVGRGYQGILANNLFEIMPDETILSKDFLFLALKYGTFEEEVHTKAFGAAMPALSFSMMNDIPVVVPVMEQQQQFVSFVEQTDKSKLCDEMGVAA